MEHPIYKKKEIKKIVYNLVKNLEYNRRKIRLLGINISNLYEKKEDMTNITIFEYLDKINNKKSQCR